LWVVVVVVVVDRDVPYRIEQRVRYGTISKYDEERESRVLL